MVSPFSKPTVGNLQRVDRDIAGEGANFGFRDGSEQASVDGVG
jgi:hypothetical protein